MSKRKKIFLWFAGAFGFLIILMLMLLLSASRFIDTQFIKEKIVAGISQSITAGIDFQKVDLSLFPRPRVTIHHIQLSLPEKAEGTVESLTAYPALIPLIKGEIRIAKVQLESPDFSFAIPEKEEAPSVAEVEEKISKIIHKLSSHTPGFVILIKNGRVDLLKDRQKFSSLENIDARIFFPTEELKLTANLRSNFSKEIKITGHLYQKEPPSTKITLDLKAMEIDVPLTQDMIFALAGDAPIVRAIFSFLKGGTVPIITIHSQGNSIADLGASENLFIRGKILDGNIFIPGPQLLFRNVKGECAISKGILDGKNIEAKLDHAELREGNLKVGLRGANAPFHLETLAKVNLEELPRHLKNVIKDIAFLKELNSIQKVNGYARGKLMLGESLDSIKPKIEVPEFTLSAFYQRIPYPVEIKRGRFSYDDKAVHVTSMNGAVGSSSFSGVTASLTLGKAPYLEVRHGASSIALEEIHSWLSSYEKFKPMFKEISSIKGSVALSSINFAGPLYRSQDWLFSAIGSADSVAINSSLLPGILIVTGKKFEVTPEQLTFTGAHASMLDGSHIISGVLKSPLKGVQYADLSLSGAFGPETASWIKDVVGLTPALRIDQQYSLSKAHILWEKNGMKTFQGEIKIQNGPHAFLDVTKHSRGIRINALHIDEGASHAMFTLNRHEKEFTLSFNGKLQGTTLRKLIYASNIPEGFIEGNFRTDINLGKPFESKAQGTLSLEKIAIPWKEKVPLEVADLSLEADANRIRVKSASVTVGKNSFSLQGTMNPAANGIEVDMDLTSDRLEWETIQKLLKFIGMGGMFSTKNDTHKLSLLGKLRMKSNTVIYDRFIISPLHTDISFTPEVISANVTKASVCNISMPGNIQFFKDSLQLDTKPSASGQELKPTLECLSHKKSIGTGIFNLSASFTAQGKSDQLIKSLDGKLDFKAKDGRIYKGAILPKIFSMINVTGIFEGGLPDLVKEGFSYQSLIIQGDIENGKMLLKEAVLNAPSMQIAATGSIDLVRKEMNVKALVSPLKPVNVIVRNIPIIKNIAGPNFASIPVKIEGNLENPEVTYMPVSEVGSGLLGIVKRTLNIPVYLIEPLIPGQKKNP